jgi:S-(hydroxymethyl)glutathione dehydrogenase/alcohol dehydrogenase
MACSVPTGWGSAVYAGGTRPGDTVVVVGCGGVGANAVQGAVHAGASNIVAVDPVAFRREFAESVGATHAVEDTRSAATLARELTRGNGADVVVLAVGATDAEGTRQAARCLGKGGTLVLTALADIGSDVTVSLQGNGLTVYEHRIQGALFGSCNAHRDVPMLLRLASEGKLELDRLVTRRYALDQLEQGFADQAAGETIRGLLVHAD